MLTNRPARAVPLILASAILFTSCGEQPTEGDATGEATLPPVPRAVDSDTTAGSISSPGPEPFVDPLEKGKILAVGRDPGCVILGNPKREDLEQMATEVQTMNDNYLLAVEDLYGHFEHLAGVMTRDQINIVAVEDIDAFGKEIYQEIGEEFPADFANHGLAYTITLLSTEDELTHIVILSHEALLDQAGSLMVLGHEIAHIEAIQEIGAKPYSELPHEKREAMAYSLNVERLEIMLGTWKRRYGEPSAKVEALKAAIKDHSGLRDDYRSQSDG